MGKQKPHLDAFSNRKDVVYVISVFNIIESRLTDILIKEIGAPKEKQAFLRDILFNSAILPFAAKVKLFRHLHATKKWPKINPELFRRIMEIRNQFAHSQRSHEIKILLGVGKGKTSVLGSSSKMMLSSVTGSGRMVKVNVVEALAEFTERSQELSEYLRALETRP